MMTTMVTRSTYMVASILASVMIRGTSIAMAEEASLSSPGPSKVGVAAVEMAKTASAQNLTLYHINPLEYPVEPINMNLADLNGAIYFDLALMFGIFWCTDTDPNIPHPKYCNNPEYNGNQEKDHRQIIGVTKLVVEVTPIDNKLYGGYAMCNICQNGTSVVSPSHKCRDGDYVCDCFSGIIYPRPKICTNPAVGRKRLYWVGDDHDDYLFREGYYDDIVPGYSSFAAMDPPPEPADLAAKSIYSQLRLLRRTHGFWYSTLDIGHDIAWRTVRVAKQITKACHAWSFVRSVREHDREHNNDRFAGCLRDECGIAVSAYTSNLTNCWVQCFSDALLGANSTSMDGYNGGGMNQRQLLEAWSRPFESDDPVLGGCPDMGLE